LNDDFVIVVDWGTSCLRAFLCKQKVCGTLEIIDSLEGDGVKQINRQFEDYLMSKIDPWRQVYGSMPLVLSGMIGSTVGWKETSYLACPISPARLAENCFNFTSKEHSVFIVPGVSFKNSDSYPDVMRGEELQVLGWLQLSLKNQSGKHLVCLPGTHTKWVYVDKGEIVNFKTSMTGELFDMLTNHSILIQQKSTNFYSEQFTEGLKLAKKKGSSKLIHDLFSVRTKQLFNELPQEAAMSYLSGLLIGSDVDAAMQCEHYQMSDFEQVTIIGAETLSQHFAQALSHFNVQSQLCDVTQASLAGYQVLCANLFANNVT